MRLEGERVRLEPLQPKHTEVVVRWRSDPAVIAQMFGDGNFEAPMLIHATKVPGTDQMAAMKNRIRFVYVETPGGGRLDIFTTDATALHAVHEFMKFQIADHRTGDTTAVTKR